MKIETVSTQEPDVVITLSWKEAELLRAICGGTGGNGPGRRFTTEVEDRLASIGISFHYRESGDSRYHGKFENE